MQGWFVIDHFGNISGALGITTAKGVDEQSAARYANVSVGLPSNWRGVAEDNCREEWPTDYQMQQYCMKQQSEGAQKLALGAPAEVDASAFQVIRGKCAEEWPRDFNMREYCEKQQYYGYRAMNASSVGDDARNTCAQQWPNDYRMR